MSTINRIKMPDNNIYELAGPTPFVVGNSSGTAGVWTGTLDGLTAYYDGLSINYLVKLKGATTTTLNLNGLGAKQVFRGATTALTTHYAVNWVVQLVYSTSGSHSGGAWYAIADYDTNTTVAYGALAYYFRPYLSAQLYRYKLCVLDKDNRLLPLTDTNVVGRYGAATSYSSGDIVNYNGKFYQSLISSNKGNTPSTATEKWQLLEGITPTATSFRPDKILWYDTTANVSAGNVVGVQTLRTNGYNATNMAVCNFNQFDTSSTVSVRSYRMIYLCGTYNKTTGLFKLRGGGTIGSNKYYTLVPNNTATIKLRNYFTSGYDYILLGSTYSSDDCIWLREENPMFHFDGTNLVPYDKWYSKTAETATNATNATKASSLEVYYYDGTDSTTAPGEPAPSGQMKAVVCKVEPATKYSGWLYLIEENNTTTDLTGTTWQINDPVPNVDPDTLLQYDLTFTSDNGYVNAIQFQYNTEISSIPAILYYTGNTWVQAYTGSWYTPGLRTIVISGGPDARNTNLIQLLQSIATRIS